MRGVQVAFGGRVVLDRVSLDVAAGERIGLVGANGSGKSTLLRLLAGTRLPDAGSVTWAPRPTIGYLAQGGDPFGAVAPVPAPRSGGEAVRAALAQLVAPPHTVLLLDEPTNHLDLDAEAWLDAALSRFHGTIVAVSHDRWFLDRLATRILEVEGGRVTSYAGNFSAYEEERAREQARRALAHEQYERARDALEAAMARQRQRAQAGQASRIKTGGDAEKGAKGFYAGKGKAAARSVANMQRRLDRLAAPAVPEPDAIQWRPSASAHLPRQLVVASGVGFHYPARPWLFRGASFVIERQDRVGVVGGNGTGKSTLLKLIQRAERPREGRLAIARCTVGTWDQDVGLPLPPDHTVLAALSARHPGRTPELRRRLGAMLLHGDRVHARVGSLSGAERVRLWLVDVLMAPPGLLLLDEPTNHLDRDSRRVVAAALAAYNGTVVLASHDRALLTGVATRLLVLDNTTLKPVFARYDTWDADRRAAIPSTSVRDQRLLLEVRLARVAAQLSTASPAQLTELSHEFQAIRQALADLASQPTGRQGP